MLRKLTVHIMVEAQAADDSPLAPLVVEALQEFIAATGRDSPKSGKFESKAGLDVTWATKNEYYDDLGNLVNAEEFKRPIATAVELIANPKGVGVFAESASADADGKLHVLSETKGNA
jgi:hypothetical protein